MRQHFSDFRALAPLCSGPLVMLAMMSARPAHGQSEASPSPSPIEQFAQRLGDAGILLNSTYLGEFASNPTGGQKHGSAYDDELSFGARFDLGKLINLKGGAVNVEFTDRNGTSLSADEINNSISVQEKYGDSQNFQLTFLTYSQTWFDGLVETQVGRDDITFHFAFQPGACLYFQSFAICNNPSFTALDVNDGSSYWPEAVWGGLLKVNPTQDLYTKVGVYQDRPALNPHLQHGFDWGTNNSNGAQLGAEVGYKNTEPGAILPDQYALGTIYDLGHYDAGFYSPDQQYGRGIIYLQVNQTVFRPQAEAPQGLYLLGGLYLGTAGESQRADYELQAGALYFGLIPSRPDDNVGFQITGLHYTRDFLNSLYDQRLADGGGGYPHSHMTMAELNYTAKVTPWLNLTPNLQYIWKPDGLGALGYPSTNLKNALVIGTQLEIDIDKMLGFAAK
jgi:porin